MKVENLASRTIPAVIALVAAGLSVSPSRAADHDASVAGAPIKGADVMGDKNRSGPDGWVQAPVARDEAPARTQKSAGETERAPAKTAPLAALPMKPGDDPGTPVDRPAGGAGRIAAPK